MNDINKSIELMKLYDLYQDLLTDKQRLYFEDYYFEDFSLAEIAEENSVSRNAIFDTIKKTVKKLNEYELKLKLNEKLAIRNELIKKLKNETNINELKKIINDLEKVE